MTVPYDMSGARQWGDNARERDRKGRVEVSKVRRYRPGQKPEWMGDGGDRGDGDHSDAEADGAETLLRAQRVAAHKVSIRVDKETTKTRERRVIAPAVVTKKGLAAHQGGTVQTQVQRPERHREVVVPPVDVDAKRAALKQRLIEEQQKAARPSSSSGEEEDDEDEDEDDYTSGSETDSSSGSEEQAPIARPTFVRKEDRKTLAEREAIEREELEKIEQEKIRAARQAQETRRIAAAKVQEEIAREEAARAGPQGAEEIVTDDDEDPEGDYDKWKEREMERLRRALEEELRVEEEEKEREAWKTMSDRDKERYLAQKTSQARYDARSKAAARKKEKDEQKDGNAARQPERGAFFRDDDRV